MWRKVAKSQKRWSCLLYACLIGFAASCGEDSRKPVGSYESGNGTASIAFKLSSALASRLSSAEIVITGSGMALIRQNLDVSGDIATGVVEVPAGTDRLFTVNGYDKEAELIYTGQGWSDVISGERVTVTIMMRPVDATVPKDWLDGTVPDLAYISFFSSVRNWDTDAEDDGIRVSISYYDSNDKFITWDNAILGVHYKVYISTSFGTLERKYDHPWFEYTGYVRSNDDSFKVPYEDFGTYDAGDTYKTVGGDVAVAVIEELSVAMSNGIRYNAQETGGIVVGD